MMHREMCMHFQDSVEACLQVTVCAGWHWDVAETITRAMKVHLNNPDTTKPQNFQTSTSSPPSFKLKLCLLHVTGDWKLVWGMPWKIRSRLMNNKCIVLPHEWSYLSPLETLVVPDWYHLALWLVPSCTMNGTEWYHLASWFTRSSPYRGGGFWVLPRSWELCRW
jgi:hypothetical protein